MFEVGRDQLDVLLQKHALRAGPEASSVTAGSWHPGGADGDGEAAKEQGPKQLHVACVESQLSQTMLEMAQVTQCLSEVSCYLF